MDRRLREYSRELKDVRSSLETKESWVKSSTDQSGDEGSNPTQDLFSTCKSCNMERMESTQRYPLEPKRKRIVDKFPGLFEIQTLPGVIMTSDIAEWALPHGKSSKHHSIRNCIPFSKEAHA